MCDLNLHTLLTNAEIALKISPDQPFYVFDRLDHVHISCSTIDEDVKPIPIAEIKCTVRTPSGEYIGPKTSKAGLLKEIIDSEIRPYCGEYDIKCQCPTVKEPSELTITIMDASRVNLFIRGLEKKIHFYPDRHTYICILEGPLVGEFQEQRYNDVQWTCSSGGKQALPRIEKNVIFIGNDTQLGPMHCTCSYSRYGLELSRSTDILVVDRERVKLTCVPMDDSDNSTYVFRCFASGVGSLVVHKPRCRIIHGYTRFETHDRTDYTEGKVDLIIYRDVPGLYTFQCVSLVDDICLSTVALFPVLSDRISILIRPRDLLAPVGSMTKCRADGMGTAYDTLMGVITSGWDRVRAVQRSVRWLGQEPPILFYPVLLTCKTSSMYMGETIASGERSIYKVVYHRFVLYLEPLKEMYSDGEKISCNSSTTYPISENNKPILNIKGLVDRDSFTRDEVGVFDYKCIQYVEKELPIVQEGWLIAKVTIAKAEIYDYYIDGEYVGWICFPSAEPRRSTSYNITFENTEISASIVEDNKIFLTEYNVAGRIVIKCTATMGGRIYEGLVITNIRGYWLTTQQLNHHLQTNRLIVFLILTTNVTLLLLITYIWVWFTAKEPTIDRHVHLDVGFLRSNYLYIGSELVGRNNLYYAAEMIQSYNELQMLISRIRLMEAGEGGEELVLGESETESITQSLASVQSEMKAGRTNPSISSTSKRDSELPSEPLSLRKSLAMTTTGRKQSMAITTEILNTHTSIPSRNSKVLPQFVEPDSEELNEELNVSHIRPVRSRRRRSRRRRLHPHRRRSRYHLRAILQSVLDVNKSPYHSTAQCMWGLEGLKRLRFPKIKSQTAHPDCHNKRKFISGISGEGRSVDGNFEIDQDTRHDSSSEQRPVAIRDTDLEIMTTNLLCLTEITFIHNYISAACECDRRHILLGHLYYLMYMNKTNVLTIMLNKVNERAPVVV
ncbi:unnamed protein product [Calicophoron daubneyi]|uniref:Uncharacterized protein n=1 Tax=Calicophoron daubneyi TaxID=300641 RepID=A0AAV2T5N5_CALDB